MMWGDAVKKENGAFYRDTYEKNKNTSRKQMKIED
jgi:hypothetical protein